MNSDGLFRQSCDHSDPSVVCCSRDHDARYNAKRIALVGGRRCDKSQPDIFPEIFHGLHIVCENIRHPAPRQRAVVLPDHLSSPRLHIQRGNCIPLPVAVVATTSRDDLLQRGNEYSIHKGIPREQIQMRRPEHFHSRRRGSMVLPCPPLPPVDPLPSVRVACVPPGRRGRCPTYRRSRLLSTIQTIVQRSVHLSIATTETATANPIPAYPIDSAFSIQNRTMMRRFLVCVSAFQCPCPNQNIAAGVNPPLLKNICSLTRGSANSAALSLVCGLKIPERCWPIRRASVSKTRTNLFAATARSRCAPRMSCKASGSNEFSSDGASGGRLPHCSIDQPGRKLPHQAIRFIFDRAALPRTNPARHEKGRGPSSRPAISPAPSDRRAA